MRIAEYGCAAVFTAIVLFGLSLAVYSRVGLRISLDQLGGYIEKAMRACADQARLLLRARGRRIEFLKLAPPGRPTRFLLLLSSRHCSVEEFAKARERLDEAGIPFRQCTGDGRPARELLIVECGRDVGLATTAAHAVLVAFGVAQGTPLRAAFVGGVDVREGAVIGWEYPDFPENVGIIEYHRPERRQEQARGSDRIRPAGEQNQDTV